MDDVTEEIRQRADIVDIINQYVALRPAGHNRWKACCPFHEEKTPSFNVSAEKGFYKCFGCGASGDVFKFLQQIENLSFPEVKKQLAERYGIALPKFGKDVSPEQQAVYDERDRLTKITAATAAFFREQFGGNKGLDARDYARSRGLSSSTLDKFGIGYAPDSWDALYRHLVNRYGFKAEDAARAGVLIEKEDIDDRTGETRLRYYDRYRHRLMFPIWDAQGRVIAFGGRALEGGETGTPDAKYINSPEGPLFNKSRTLYGWHLARAEAGKRESVILTEGYMDAIALHEGGFGNTMAALGTALTPQHVSALKRLAPKTVYLCYDGDSAGIRAALRAAPLFEQHELTARVIALPNGEDPDTFIRQHGQAGFDKAISDAKLLSRYRLEMAVADFDWHELGDRLEAIRAGAEVIAEVENDIEKDDYIQWLSDRWAQAEGVTDTTRLQTFQSSVRREVKAALKRKRPVSSTRNAQSERPAFQQAFNNQQKRNYNAQLDEWQPNDADAPPEEDDSLEVVANNQLNGVTKAERLLLSSLLGSPSWRARILDKLPASRWTQEIHREIAEALRQRNLDEGFDVMSLLNTLSPEANLLAGELLMGQDAQTVATDRVIDSYIARIEGHWARQAEREIMEMARLRRERQDKISPEELETVRYIHRTTGRGWGPE